MDNSSLRNYYSLASQGGVGLRSEISENIYEEEEKSDIRSKKSFS